MKVVRIAKVLEMTGLSRSSLYEIMGRGEFPSSIKLGIRSVGWLESEVLDWIEDRLSQRASAYCLGKQLSACAKS